MRHHWIYSGAVAKFPSFEEKSGLVDVYAHDGRKLGIALFNKGHSIVGHMLAFAEETIDEALQGRIRSALQLRRRWFDPSHTNAFRLINAEGDGIPGVIVDCYNDVLILQISHPVIDSHFKPKLIDYLIQECKPRAIFEKSTSFMRRKEGLPEVRLHHYGEPVTQVPILEKGLHFMVDLVEGQKTGLFLDQREMRSLVKELSANRRVLNCFAYTGGFSVAALAGGAQFVDSVEISAKCAPLVEQNLTLNRLQNHRFIQEDVFEFLKNTPLDSYDLIILDPPAFVKKRDDIDKAFRAYKDLNRHTMQKMGANTLLLTCSCSYHVGEELFQNILFRAAVEAGRQVRILSRHRQALDHSISIFHPESAYLKSFLLHIV